MTKKSSGDYSNSEQMLSLSHAIIKPLYIPNFCYFWIENKNYQIKRNEDHNRTF
jgi:hypothetical protein